MRPFLGKYLSMAQLSMSPTFVNLFKWHFTRYTLHSQVTEPLMINSTVLDIPDIGCRKNSETEENFCTALLFNATLQ